MRSAYLHVVGPLLLAATVCRLAAAAPTSAPAIAPSGAPASAPASEPAAEPAVMPVEEQARFRPGTGYFNFEKAELLDVVEQISKLTLVNFIIPEQLKAQPITIICERPVTSREALMAFLSALESSGFALVPAGRFFKIVQRREAIRKPVPTLVEADATPLTEDFVTVVIDLEHIDPEPVLGQINSLVSNDGQLFTVGSSALVLTDSAANVRRLRRVIAALDVPGSRNKVHILDVRYAAADELARTLEQVFGGQRGPGRGEVQITASGPDGAQAGDGAAAAKKILVRLDKVVADERTNKLILVCSAEAFEPIGRFVRQLDVPLDEGSPQTHVYYLHNAVSEEVARTIQTLAQGSQAPKGDKPAGQVGAAELFEGQIKVTADKATNSLVIVATGRDYKRLIRVIERLDVRRPQVFVEAVIMEMSLSKQLDLGLNMFTGYHAGQELITSAGTSAATSAIAGQSATTAVSAANLAAFLGFLSYRGPIVPGSDAVLPGGLPSVGVVLQALQSDADVDVLSTPHILTTDNEKAEILVGQNVPFAGSISGGGAAGGYSSFFPMVSVQRQDVALKFAVTPHVSEDGQVRLEIEQEISDLGEHINVGYGQTQPVTTKRNAKTTVVVKDQQTIILGGLVSERRNTRERKIPLLGDVPILGWLFKDYGENREKRNLLLVLTPYIIEGDEDFRRIYERKLRERREFVEFFYGGQDIFQVPVEYAKKTGAYGRLHHQIVHEMQRIENGGPGHGDEVLVQPPPLDQPEESAESR